MKTKKWVEEEKVAAETPTTPKHEQEKKKRSRKNKFEEMELLFFRLVVALALMKFLCNSRLKQLPFNMRIAVDCWVGLAHFQCVYVLECMWFYRACMRGTVESIH